MWTWIKEKLKSIFISVGIITVALAAPVVPVGNGLISVAVFEDSQSQKVYIQISDEQYALMGSEPGIAYNPQDHDGLKYTGHSYQYPVKTYQKVLHAQTATSTEKSNPQKEFSDVDSQQSLFNVLVPNAEAAIARDTFLARSANVGTSHTEAMTITGSNTAIVLFTEHSTSETANTATYGGDSLTKVDSLDPFGTNRTDSWILVGTKTGANNIVVTFSSSASSNIMAESYTDVGVGGSTGGADAHNTTSFASSASDQSIITTTIADNAWIPVYFRASGGSYSAGVNVSIQDNVANIALMGDTNSAITPAGATTQTFTHNSGTQNGGLLSVSLKPFEEVAAPLVTPQSIIWFY